jgi:hypothetical protein
MSLMGQGLQKALRLEAEADLLRENISSTVGKSVPGRKTLLDYQPWKEITFDSDGTAVLKLRGPEAKTNSHSHKRRRMVALCPRGKTTLDT